MYIIYGTKNAAKWLGIQENTLYEIMRRYPDFPRKKLDNITLNAFDPDDIMIWYKQYSPGAYKKELETAEMMILSNFAKTLGVTRTMVNYWMKHGLQYNKLLNSKVLIDVEQARRWFIKQNHPQTRAYAQKLSSKGIE